MARASIKGILGALMVGSSRGPYTKLNQSTRSEDEIPEPRLSTTNTESSLARTTRAAGSAGSEDRSRLFDAGKTTSFSEHYVMELFEDSVLGVGSTAEVRSCTEIHTGEKLACKVIFKLSLSPRQRQRIINETKIHSFLSGHPLVVRLVDVCEDDDCVYIIMEHCKGGNLLKLLHDETLPEAKAADIMTMLAEFLHFCHRKGVVHRDLKPENILLGEKYSLNDLPSIKVADFGTAFQITISENPGTIVSGRTHFLGSHGYIAPEILRGESYGPPIDVWSAGVVLCNLLAGQMPFTRDDYQDLRQNRATLNFHKNDNWRAVPTEAHSLIAGMLTLDPAARMTADQICVHPWIKKHAKKRDAKGKRAAIFKRLPKFRGSRSGSDSAVLTCFGGTPAPGT